MPDFRRHIKAGFTKVRSAFLRYTEKEYAIVGKVLADMATARIHSIKPTQISRKTTQNGETITKIGRKMTEKTVKTKKENNGSTITHNSRSL